MKAILVIDMPKDCYECPCVCDEFNSCQACNDRRRGSDEKGIPSWCPLRPLPQKKWHEEGKENECEEWYRNGWNDCLEEITGETE